MTQINLKRTRKLNSFDFKEGKVIYWMSRDQRSKDNWALVYSQQISNKNTSVVFCLIPSFLNARKKQYSFMTEGLKQVEKNLAKKNIPFYILYGDPKKEIVDFITKNDIKAIISDFDPLKIKRKWKKDIIKNINIPFYEVDTHNIVPCWIASNKQEYGAHTLRPKIKRLLPEFLTDFPDIKKQKDQKLPKNNWKKIETLIGIDEKNKEKNLFKSGEKQAKKILDKFKKNTKNYSKYRNDPNKEVLSNLSPYLHFGQISSQRIALEIKSRTFRDELIIRKELADNFCLYNKDYDNVNGFPKWAKHSLDKHIKDKKEYDYSLNDLENAKTHDKLWNAAQIQMIKKGKMHSYLRMYWAKKILEWSRSVEQAMKNAIYLNDKYELDGRDPNGYTGIAWSIGGVHDRPWPERKIFGKIRYMSYEGCKSKFDVDKFISKYSDKINKS